MKSGSNSSPAAASLPAIRHSLRFKVLLGLTIFNIAATVIFSVNHYLVERGHIMADLQDKLSDYTHAIDKMLPDGFIDRAVSPTAVSPEEYRRVVEKLTDYCNDAGLRYLYTYARTPEGFFCTASNGTPEEMAAGSFTPYWDHYTSAPPEITRAWDTNQPVYADVTDTWGRSYSLFAPMTTAAGTRYIAGADLAITYVNDLLTQSLNRSIAIGVGVFVLFFVISYLMSTRFSRKIMQLAAYTQELSRSNFRPEVTSPLRLTIVAIPQRTKDEVGQLASSFIVMEDQLGTYLHELKETTAAKERFHNELKIAGDIQSAMLPHEFPASARIDLHAAMKPAKEAGGDLYDCFFLDPDHLCFVIGDVSDKGMPAAIFMAVTLTILRAKATAELAGSPEEILRLTNELLVTQNQMYQFVTAFLGVINVRTGEVIYSDGGHNRPYHRSASGARMLPPGGGIALGVMPGAAFKRHTLQLQPGDTLFLYTDGVTEAIAADESFYGEPRLEKLLSAHPLESTACDWVNLVAKDVADFSLGHAQADDITVLAVRFKV
jgi:sigma-B regulation protein RsbU (phosphoserine phosphatase)